MFFFVEDYLFCSPRLCTYKSAALRLILFSFWIAVSKSGNYNINPCLQSSQTVKARCFRCERCG